MQVEHQESRNRFVVRVEGGDGDDAQHEEAELAYRRVGPTIIDLQHTYVPESARGHGVAEALARAALGYARERGYRVVPTCPFVRQWLRTHPEDATLVDAPYATFLEERPRP
jgi:predicted GNAT family acetyltransferase